MLQSHQFKNKMDCSLHIIYQDLSGEKPSKTDNLSVHSANRLLKISRENILLGSLGPLKKCMIMKKGRNCFSHPFQGIQAQIHQRMQALVLTTVQRQASLRHTLTSQASALLSWAWTIQKWASAKDPLVTQHSFSSHTAASMAQLLSLK